jgi:hypothetical protein
MSSKLQLGVLVFGIFIGGVLAIPAMVSAQQPKLDIKLFAGASATTYVSLLESGRVRDTFAGWQIGFGPRYRKRRWFVEVLFSFNRWALRLNGELPIEGTDIVLPFSARGQVNSFELPINGGFIPYKNAYFKLFLYVGYVNHFNTKIVRASATVQIPEELGGGDEVISLNGRPKSLGLAVYQALARFGINFDLAMFNFDFNYSISMNSAGTDPYRTSYHQLQLNAAYLF